MRFLDGPATSRRLRAALDAAGFDFGAMTERLGPHAIAHVAAGELAPLVRASRAGDALDTLLRLFVVGVPVPLDQALRVLAPVPVEELAAGGVVGIDGDDVEARITVRPLDAPAAWVVAHDRTPRAGAPLAADHVIGVSASSMALAGATVRRPGVSTLDIGTGCGALPWRRLI